MGFTLYILYERFNNNYVESTSPVSLYNSVLYLLLYSVERQPRCFRIWCEETEKRKVIGGSSEIARHVANCFVDSILHSHVGKLFEIPILTVTILIARIETRTLDSIHERKCSPANRTLRTANLFVPFARKKTFANRTVSFSARPFEHSSRSSHFRKERNGVPSRSRSVSSFPPHSSVRVNSPRGISTARAGHWRTDSVDTEHRAACHGTAKEA